MMTYAQIREFSSKFKIAESVIAREYIQVLFLKELYSENFSKNIFFKGGTAIRLLFSGTRFSEDLDFTVTCSLEDFNKFISIFFLRLNKNYGFTFKKRKTLSGEKYLLSYLDNALGTNIFISLDFSFREKVLDESMTIIDSPYPVLFNSFVYHLSKEEVLSEKVRALMTREKGRDIYDFWFLLSNNVELKINFVMEKLKYYKIENFSYMDLIARLEKFSQEKFVLDLKPFVPLNEREKLAEFFKFTIVFLKQKLS